jgi:hypothetical protein
VRQRPLSGVGPSSVRRAMPPQSSRVRSTRASPRDAAPDCIFGHFRGRIAVGFTLTATSISRRSRLDIAKEPTRSEWGPGWSPATSRTNSGRGEDAAEDESAAGLGAAVRRRRYRRARTRGRQGRSPGNGRRCGERDIDELVRRALEPARDEGHEQGEAESQRGSRHRAQERRRADRCRHRAQRSRPRRLGRDDRDHGQRARPHAAGVRRLLRPVVQGSRRVRPRRRRLQRHRRSGLPAGSAS